LIFSHEPFFKIDSPTTNSKKVLIDKKEKYKERYKKQLKNYNKKAITFFTQFSHEIKMSMKCE